MGATPGEGLKTEKLAEKLAQDHPQDSAIIVLPSLPSLDLALAGQLMHLICPCQEKDTGAMETFAIFD
jgi:hypothetical protein